MFMRRPQASALTPVQGPAVVSLERAREPHSLLDSFEGVAHVGLRAGAYNRPLFSST
jgi:hypothetical protein